MSLYKKFGSNKEKTDKGIWFEIDADNNDDGSYLTPRFRMSFMSVSSNPRFAAVAERLTRPYMRKIAAGILPRAQQVKLERDTFVEAILHDWENVFDQNDKPLPYSKQAARILLADLPELFSLLTDIAQDLSNFQDEGEMDEEDLGNLKNGSHGKSKVKNPTS